MQLDATGIITDLDVCINSDHTWPGDLKVELRNDSTMTSITLFNRPGGGDYGCGEAGLELYLNDDAQFSVQDPEACTLSGVVGEFAPLEPLSSFNGENINGMWTLIIKDEYPDDTGNLTGFYMWPTLQP